MAKRKHTKKEVEKILAEMHEAIERAPRNPVPVTVYVQMEERPTPIKTAKRDGKVKP